MQAMPTDDPLTHFSAAGAAHMVEIESKSPTPRRAVATARVRMAPATLLRILEGQVGKGGVVRDPALHAEVCQRIEAWLNGLPNWRVLGLTESPITGPEGNKEFLIAAVRD